MLGIAVFLIWGLAGFLVVSHTLPRPVLALHRETTAYLLFKILAGLWLGLISAGQIIFWLTWGLRSLGADHLFPLAPERIALIIITVPAALFILITTLRRYLPNIMNPSLEKHQLAVKRRACCRALVPLVVLGVLGTIFAIFLLTTSFYLKNDYMTAGASVFSDLSPHTALVSAFAKGANIPPDYPHFALDGIRYHFFFYHLAGQLHLLGLSLTLSLNLLSGLGMVSFLLLLGLLAYRLTGRRWSILLAPFLALFRSSAAFFTNIAKLVADSQVDGISVLEKMKNAYTFIGNTPRDEWGLWSVNVYANQRHLPAALSVLLIILLLQFGFILPQEGKIKRPTGDKITERKNFFSAIAQRAYYFFRQDRPLDLKGSGALIIVYLLLLPYFHGSVFVTSLLLLFFMAFFSGNSIGLVMAAATSIAAAFIYQRALSPGASLPGTIWQWGFIVKDKSPGGVLLYLLELTGIAFPLVIIAIIILPRKLKLWTSLAFAPLVIAFTISLTPDVTVNHKYIMFSLILWSVSLAALLLKLWKKHSVLRRGLCIILILILTVTGIYETHIFKNASSVHIAVDTNNKVTSWIEKMCAPDAVFLTAPLAMHGFFLSGRRAWLGHSYYAWSAGHDTRTRETAVRELATNYDATANLRYLQNSGIDAILVDRNWRDNKDIPVNEAWIADNFECVAEFNDDAGTRIYQVNKELFSPIPLHR